MTKTLSLAGVASHTAPKGLTGFLRWLWHHRRNKKAGNPSKELVYAEGVAIVRAFLAFAAKHGVGELQKFTASHVPSPTWVSVLRVSVSQANINRAAHLLHNALSVDRRTVELVGGEKWWTLRGRDLTGEWIELKKDKIKRGAKPPERVLFYLHGLAPQYPFPCALHDALASYLFLIDPPNDGSVAHEPVPPENIILSGDSAGGGLALSLLVVLRDLGLPMPAGATLISPWVDLAHSFPSVGGDGNGDYIPPNGFIYRPDLVWPPPPNPATGIEQVLVGEEALAANGQDVVVRLDEQVQMYCPNNMLDHPLVSPVNQGSLGGLCPLYICCGGAELLHDEIIHVAHKAANPSSYPPAQRILEQYPSQRKHFEQDYPPTQVQLQVFDGGCHVVTTLSITSLAKYMYRGAANAGLFFLAAAKARSSRRENHGHAANSVAPSSSSSSFSHSPASHSATPETSSSQPTTISAANASAPVEPGLRTADQQVANATEHEEASDANSEEERDSSDAESYANTESEHSSLSEHEIEEAAAAAAAAAPSSTTTENVPPQRITATGHLPAFSSSPAGAANMIRQRVNLHGFIRPLEPASQLDGCTMNSEHIGLLHAVPVRKWLAQRREWDDKYAKDLAHFRELKRADWEAAQRSGWLLGQFEGERPPLGSVAAWHDEALAKEAARSVDEAGKKTKATMALSMWSGISAKPDEEVAGDKKVEEVKAKLEREGDERQEQAPTSREKEPATASATA
ncbi:hypothetical protein Rhopal_000032-T1 [Rhodotorula paludigena]|uniref:Alpha/beta hydrolase fold-3 domain-containing protein n=1 Tax=Rhodotorula paludigena TaxID=86838 RepID=A0AAV5GCM0_9BASI|nr:hypothetical protein Rhopal_000032-T1 [Rhodotorula paludigena]